MAKRNDRRKYRYRFKSLAHVKFLILMVAFEIVGILIWMGLWPELISLVMTLAMFIFYSAITALGLIMVSILLVAIFPPTKGNLAKKRKPLTVNRWDTKLSMWLLGENYNDVMGDLYEELEELRIHERSEWWIRILIACKWFDAVATSMTGTITLRVFKGLKRAHHR